MKRARSVGAPTRKDLREMPEVDFAAYRVRKNPFAKRIAREGIEIIAGRPAQRRAVHERGPSRSSLREMPEVDLSKSRARQNPYARRIAAEGITLQIGRGRPKRGAETGPTVPKSVRLPEQVWERLAQRAQEEGITLHAALRAAAIEWLNRAA